MYNYIHKAVPMGGQQVRWLFTPRGARADFILLQYRLPAAVRRNPHGGRLTNPMTWLMGAHAQVYRPRAPILVCMAARKAFFVHHL